LSRCRGKANETRVASGISDVSDIQPMHFSCKVFYLVYGRLDRRYRRGGEGYVFGLYFLSNIFSLLFFV
jgi:hypothetical protein